MNSHNSLKGTRKSGSPFLIYRRKLQEKKGDFTIQSAFILFFVMLLLVLFISVFGVVNTSMKLHSVAADLVRYIEVRGQIDGPVYTELSRLSNVVGVTIENHSITGTYFNGSKLQFGTDFTVTLSTTGHIGVGGVLSLPVPLNSTVTGRSEQYWK